MSKFTFLTKEQCFGEDRLDIFEKRGLLAKITDFSILIGGYCSNDDEQIGEYWTKTNYLDEKQVWIVDECGYSDIYKIDDGIDTGARLCLKIIREEGIQTNTGVGKRAEDGLLEVEFGYYPQLNFRFLL